MKKRKKESLNVKIWREIIHTNSGVKTQLTAKMPRQIPVAGCSN